MSTSLPPIRRVPTSDHTESKAASTKPAPHTSKPIFTSHDIHLKVVHIANKDFSGYNGSDHHQHSNRSSDTKEDETAFDTTSNSGRTSGQTVLPPIRHQFPQIHASLSRPAKNYRPTLLDVPQIRKAIFDFQVNDMDRRAQFNKISDIFYNNLQIDGYLANEANARKMNTNSFMNALDVYMPPIKKKTKKARLASSHPPGEQAAKEHSMEVESLESHDSSKSHGEKESAPRKSRKPDHQISGKKINKEEKRQSAVKQQHDTNTDNREGRERPTEKVHQEKKREEETVKEELDDKEKSTIIEVEKADETSVTRESGKVREASSRKATEKVTRENSETEDDDNVIEKSNNTKTETVRNEKSAKKSANKRNVLKSNDSEAEKIRGESPTKAAEKVHQANSEDTNTVSVRENSDNKGTETVRNEKSARKSAKKSANKRNVENSGNTEAEKPREISPNKAVEMPHEQTDEK
jgi:hypothetical protein